MLEASAKLKQALEKSNTVKIDDREGYSPGWKFHEWELKGVPLRLEIGPRELDNNQATLSRRDTGERETASLDSLPETIPAQLEDIQRALFDRALKFREANTSRVDEFDTFRSRMDQEGGLLLCHWCGKTECEEAVQEETKATIRCIPLDQEKESGRCVRCGESSGGRVYFAKGY